MSLSTILSSGFDWFHRIPRYHLGDEVISSVIERAPQNTDLTEVLTKVVLINSIYGTAIYDTLKVAQHICSLQFDSKIREGDISLIDDIRSGHGILTRSMNHRDLYSFATKYASWHSPEHFPIYDRLVKRLLPKLNGESEFYDHFTQKDLDVYVTLKNVIDSLTGKLGLEDLRYRKIDKGLWLYAKYRYKRSELPQEIVGEIENAANVV